MTELTQTTRLNQPRYLWFLVLSYCMVMVLANWFDPRLVRIFSLNTDAGTLIFPLTFLLSDLITEVYGYQHARRAIWCGFLFNFVFIIYAQIVIHLPSPDYAVTSNTQFDALLTMNFRIIVASAISYLCAEPLNSLIMAKLKIWCHGNKLAARFIASTFTASGVDSFLFGIGAFFGLMSNINLLFLILTMWGFKIAIEISGLPLSIYLTRKIKGLEQIDIYDTQTDFNLFSLTVDYSSHNNQYIKQLTKI